MSRILHVAWRDFRHTVLTKAFLFAVIGVPIFIAAIGGLSAVIMTGHEEPPMVGTVAIATDDSRLIDAALIEFDDEHVAGDRGGMPGKPTDVTVEIETVDAIATDAPLPESLRTRMGDGSLLAVAIVAPEALAAPDADDPSGATPRFRLVVPEGLDSDHVGLIERRTGAAIVRVRAVDAGLDVEVARALLRRPRSDTARLAADGTESGESEDFREIRRLLVPMAFMMLLWVAAFTSGQHLLMSTIEEKSNKVMEVLLSAVSPLQLLAGKIIGQGAVGLIIIGVYSSLGIAALVFAAAMDLIAPMQLVWLAVFFFMAYFMVAALMAAVGSAVSDIREANSLMMPVMIVLMFPLMLWMPISQSPNGMVATIFSFIPPAIPFAMTLRIAAEDPVPLWQMPATIAWGYACTIAMIWMAARVFRVGVLMTGKPPSPLELIRWMRYS